jgi:hypothetical protein
MKNTDLISKSCDFYSAEADKLVEKLAKCKTQKQIEKTLLELDALKKKISYEISQINKLEEESGEDFF